MEVETNNIIDLSYLEITFDGNKEVINKVLQTFLKNTFQLLAELDQELAMDNWDNVKMHAHTLKSSFNTVGAKRVADILARIELDSLEENKVEINGLIIQVKELSQQVFSEIESKL